MNFYIAARFSRRHEANSIANFLQEMGHTITSRWALPGSNHIMPAGMSAQASDAERTRFATEDCEDVRACDVVVSLMEEPRSNGRGGRHVEFGYALGLGKKLMIIGPRETVFHHLPDVMHFETKTHLVAYMLGQKPLDDEIVWTTCGCPCEPYGLDGLKCPDPATGKLRCEP